MKYGEALQGTEALSAYRTLPAHISLIDGNRLIELALKHQIGVRRKPVELVELDEAFFSGDADAIEGSTVNSIES